MRRWIAVTTLAIGVVSAATTATAPAALAQDAAAPQVQEIGLLFAQTANRGTMKPIKGTPRFNLELRGVNSQVVWFSDRPARQSGHIPIRAFSRAWPGFGFEEDPPNAALTLLDAGDRHDTVVVELGRPHFKRKKEKIRYSARLLDEATGNLSHLESDRDPRVKRRFRSPSLFIDDAAGRVVGNYVIQPLTRCPGANLRSADLTEAWLTGADLSGANLFRATLIQADLRKANLNQASLEFADLSAAILGGAGFQSADLSGANLSSAFGGAGFQSANLSGANIVGALLRSSRFDWATLTNADLRGSTFEGSNFQHADLRFVNLTKAKLQVTGFLGADLRGAELTGANLRGARMNEANLNGATGADLSGARLCRTRMPDGDISNRDC